MDLEKVATEGTYYNPATSHYNSSCRVICDRCKTENLPACIGLGQLDLCLNCASDISKIQQTRRRQEQEQNMTFMEQSAFRPPSQIMTMMQQSIFRPSSQNMTRMEQAALHPSSQNMTFMEQSALRPSAQNMTRMEQSSIRPRTVYLTKMAQSMFRSEDTDF